MKTKKILCLVLAMLMLMAVLSSCGGSKSGSSTSTTSTAPIELKLNITTGETSVWQVAANTFKQLIEERTEGRYTISIFPNEQLSGGDMQKGCEMIFTGVTDVDIHSVMNMTGFEPKLFVMTMPWIFTKGYESVDEILLNPGAPGGEALMDLIRAKGAEPLALAENGFRQITNNVRPITSPADMVGMKIRIPANNMYISLFQKLGADPTSMNFAEVFTALQQGTIDGQENPLDTIRSAKIQEVQKYLTMWNYSYDAICLSVSGKVWNSLSDADKEIFRQAAQEACAAEIAASRANDGNIRAEFEAAGVQITDLTDEQIKAFQDAVNPLYEEYREQIGEDLFAAFGYTFD
ncbi:MAG: DctP family TRAP transporter solute-binding subunit [Oscillospiraceae bacterium]|nr:DctP family TRAP transporter solute-binding subunit [Oscillospiraceae bacterium]